jgi:hypothetical protein
MQSVARPGARQHPLPDAEIDGVKVTWCASLKYWKWPITPP